MRGAAELTGSYRFGIKKDLAAAELRRLATLVEQGLLHIQSINNVMALHPENYVRDTLTIEFIQKEIT